VSYRAAIILVLLGVLAEFLLAAAQEADYETRCAAAQGLIFADFHVIQCQREDGTVIPIPRTTWKVTP
jgi:hypothetical protein